MKTAPNASKLLQEVLDESAPPDQSLGPMLRAVRAQRRRRQAAPLVAVMAAASLAWTWSALHWHGSVSNDSTDSGLAHETPVAPPAGSSFVQVRTVALPESERVATPAGGVWVARVSTEPDFDLRISDRELFALAGGRGVGLLRLAAHTEFVVARGFYAQQSFNQVNYSR